MFCANCGTKNEDGAVFCAGCGQKLEGAPVAMAPASEVNVAPAPAPVELTGLEDEATVAAYFNPSTGMATPVAPTPVAPVAPAPEVVAQPVAPVAPAPEVVAQPAAPVAPAPENYVQPTAPVAPGPENYAQPTAPVAPGPENYAQPTAPVAPGPESYVQPTGNVAPVAPTTPAKEKKPVNKAIFFIIGGVAAVLVIAIIIIAALTLGGGSGTKYADDWNSWYNVEDEMTNVAYGSTIFKDKIDGKAYGLCSSADNTIRVYYNEEDEYFVATSKGKITSLGEDLSSVNISYDGSTIAYIDEDNTLFTYKVSNGSKSKISEDVYSVVLSPSGKSLAYVVDDDDTMVLYACNGKNSTKLSKNADPIGLTDDCKYIYYYDTNKYALYVTNLKDDSNKIDSDASGSYFFNSTHTQLMYTSRNGVYVTINGGDKQKVTSKNGSPILLKAYAGNISHYDNVSGAYTYSEKSLNNNYFYIDDTIYYVTKKWEADKAVSGVNRLQVSEDVKTIYYTNDNGTLYVCKLDGKKYESTKIKSDVTSFSATRDCSAVYYIVDNDSLYYQKGKSDSKKIATDAYRVSVSADGIAFFMTDYDSDDETGMLYYSKAGKDKEKISSDCYSFFCDRNCVVYYSDYEYNSSDSSSSYSYSYTYSVNIAKSGTKFTKVLEDIGYKYSYTY